MRLPTAQESFDHARRLAAALGCNFIPTAVDTRRPLDDWAHLHSPMSPRVSAAKVVEWGAKALARERRGVPTAWALLPGSGRLAVLDVDDPAQVDRLLEIHGETPLVVRSPTVGRAHLYFKWPRMTDGDISSIHESGLQGYALKARGGTIHCPGSLHKSGRGWYRPSLPISEWTPGLRDRLPELDLAAIEEDRPRARKAVAAMSGPPVWALDHVGARRLAAWLLKAEHRDGGREAKTLAAGYAAGDFGLRLGLAIELIVAWDARSGSPRGAADTEATVRNAYRSRQNPIGHCSGDDPGDVDADALLFDLAQLKANPDGVRAAADAWTSLTP